MKTWLSILAAIVLAGLAGTRTPAAAEGPAPARIPLPIVLGGTMAGKSQILKQIDEQYQGDAAFWDANTVDPSDDDAPPTPEGVSIQAIGDAVVVTVDFHVDKAHMFPRFQEFIMRVKPVGSDIDDGSGVEVGRFSGSTKTWQPPHGGYQGWWVNLTAVTNNEIESAPTDWYQTLISTFYDDFRRYGNGDGTQDLESLCWLQLSDFDDPDDWTPFSSSVAANTTPGEFVEGNGGVKWTADNANDQVYGYGIDLAPTHRFTADDYVTLFYYIHSASATRIRLSFFGASGEFYYDITDLAAGAHYLKVKRSEFDVLSGAPDWNEGQTPRFEVDDAIEVTFDDLRLVKASALDPAGYSNTGDAWQPTGGTWVVIDGD
jgi:hypothetical protein